MQSEIFPRIHVVATAGTIASGKDYISDMIRDEYSIPKTTVSSILRDIATQRGISQPSRQDLIDISNELTKTHAGDGSILARMTYEQAISEGKKHIQIVGMRQSPQMTYLMSEASRLTSIALYAYPEIRMYRDNIRKAKNREELWTDVRTFISTEAEQNTGTNNDLFTLMSLCRYHWLADGSVVDTGKKEHIPTLEKYDKYTIGHIIRNRPEDMRDSLGGEVIISPMSELADAESQEQMDKKILENPSLAVLHRQRTKTVTRLILGHSEFGHRYLDGYAMAKQ